jgi:GR25 family glycosyltransferase involved in LPS biosynthesis
MNNPFDFFDKIFYINLDSRPERKEFMENQFSKYNIKAERFSAVYLTDEQNKELVNRGFNFYDDTRPDYSPRIKSSTISHLSLIFKSKLFGYENVLIFEDDAVFDENIMEDLQKSVEDLQKLDWDVFFLGCGPLEVYKKTENLGRVVRALSSHAYAINGTYFSSILNNLHFFKTYPAIDHHYGHLGRDVNNKVFMSLKNLVYQKNGYSDIEKVDAVYDANHLYKENIK